MVAPAPVFWLTQPRANRTRTVPFSFGLGPVCSRTVSRFVRVWPRQGKRRPALELLDDLADLQRPGRSRRHLKPGPHLGLQLAPMSRTARNRCCLAGPAVHVLEKFVCLPLPVFLFQPFEAADCCTCLDPTPAGGLASIRRARFIVAVTQRQPRPKTGRWSVHTGSVCTHLVHARQLTCFAAG